MFVHGNKYGRLGVNCQGFLFHCGELAMAVIAQTKIGVFPIAEDKIFFGHLAIAMVALGGFRLVEHGVHHFRGQP